MNKSNHNKINSRRLPDGSYTKSGKETLVEFSRIHFPDCIMFEELSEEMSGLEEYRCRSAGENLNPARRMVEQR
jgi:hypothetical protein